MKVFLRYYVELPFPAQAIDELIGRLPNEWLDRAAGDANLRGLLMLGAPTARELDLPPANVVVSLSAGQHEGSLVRRAVEWWSIRGDESEAILRGDLELAQLGPCRTQLALSAQYRPFVAAHQDADRAAAQRVAESTLKAFVDRLAYDLQVILGGARGAPTGPADRWPTVEYEGRPQTGRRLRPAS